MLTKITQYIEHQWQTNECTIAIDFMFVKVNSAYNTIFNKLYNNVASYAKKHKG